MENESAGTSASSEQLICPLCSKVCKSKRGFTQHSTAAHGVTPPDQEALAEAPPSADAADESSRRKRGKGSVLLPSKRIKTDESKESESEAESSIGSTSDSEKAQSSNILKPKTTEVSMRAKRRGLYTPASADQTTSRNAEQSTLGVQSSKDSEPLSTVDSEASVDVGGNINDKCIEEKNQESSSNDPETKLLLDLARNAISNTEIMSGDDVLILDMLLDEEYGSLLMEDMSVAQQPELNLSTQPDIATQLDEDIDEIVTDVISDDMTIINPHKETPDLDQTVAEGVEQDFILMEESMENPFYTAPIFIEDPRDADCWEYEVASELVQRVSDDWQIFMSENGVRLVLLSSFENMSVERCISWNGSDAKIFVHNREIPECHILRKVPLPHSESDICDYLTKLAHLVCNTSICKGVRLYCDEWRRGMESSEGYIEPKFYQGLECFRDKECLLLAIDADVCEACHSRKAIMRNRSWRKKHAGGNQEKRNIRYMTNAEKNEKLKTVIQKNQELRKRTYNLKTSLEKFMEKNPVEVGQDLNEDLSKIFKGNKLTRVQQLFWGSQIKAHSKQDLRGMRWSPFMIRLALRIQMLTGKEGYDSLRQVLFLPSQRRLYDFTHFTQAKEGVQEEILENIQKDFEKSCQKEHEKYFNLILDEMDIRCDIVISRKTGDVIGFMNLFPVEAEMEKLEKEMIEGKEFHPPPAKKVLVFMIQGICNSIQEVVSLYTTSGALNASQLYSRFWKTVFSCEKHNLKILCAIGDGAPVNKKFINMHAPFQDLDSNEEHLPEADFVFCTRNFACADEWRPLFFMIDPPHLLKTLRNCFANSYAHKMTRCMWKNGQDISWTSIEALYAIALKCKYKGTKLTKGHIKLTAHSCMKVVYAAQVMSISVVQALEHFKDHEKFEDVPITETQKMLETVNNWFDCHNGGGDDTSIRTQENPLLKNYDDENDSRFDFLTNTVLKYFDDWKNDTMKRPGKFKSEERERMFISHQSYESLKVTIHGFIGSIKFMLKVGAPSVIARRFNSDLIEQFFARLRMAFGSNRNPDVTQVAQKVLALHQQKGVSLSSKKGNTQVSSVDFVPNEEKLRSRKK